MYVCGNKLPCISYIYRLQWDGKASPFYLSMLVVTGKVLSVTWHKILLKDRLWWLCNRLAPVTINAEKACFSFCVCVCFWFFVVFFWGGGGTQQQYMHKISARMCKSCNLTQYRKLFLLCYQTAKSTQVMLLDNLGKLLINTSSHLLVSPVGAFGLELCSQSVHGAYSSERVKERTFDCSSL